VQPAPHAQVQYATLGWRAAAVIIDTLVVMIPFEVILIAGGVVHLPTTGTLTFQDAVGALPTWVSPVGILLEFVYFTLLELTGATLGKRLFSMEVRAESGTRASAWAVLVRNIVRIPEMLLYYIPSAISVAVNPQRKRLGDFAARTVVVRRVARPAAVGAVWPASAAPAPVPPPPAVAPPAAEPAGLTAGVPAPDGLAPAASPPAGPPPLTAAIDTLREAALTVLGAHHLYLRFSEIELARGGGETAELSHEYAAAWYALADAVVALQQAHSVAQQAAARDGVTLQDACAGRPDLVHLFGELEPYFTAGSDEDVHEAYLTVARRESSG
jgi:uncharacterized RDD family membrane protein YckC